MSMQPKRAPAGTKTQRPQSAKPVTQIASTDRAVPVRLELGSAPRGTHPKVKATSPSIHPSAQEFLLAREHARRALLTREEGREKRKAQFLLPQKALSDCAHRIPRLPQPAPDQLSPGADVPTWVRTRIVPAIREFQRLEAALGHSLRAVLEAPLPPNTREARQEYRRLMRELFMALYDSDASDAAVESSITSLQALAAADEGEVDLLAEWFDIATDALGEKLVAIASACDETGQSPTVVAAKLLCPVEVPRQRKAKRTGRPRSLDVERARRISERWASGFCPNRVALFAEFGLTLEDGTRLMDAYRKHCDREA